jgi:Ca2+-binding EF-hand superfamily protein
VPLAGRIFVIEGTDKYTMTYMVGRPRSFPFADITTLANKVHEALRNRGKMAKDAFLAVDTDRSGYITFAEFKVYINGMMPEDLNDMEMLTLMHCFDDNSDGRVRFDEFVAWVSDPKAKVPTHLVEGDLAEMREKMAEAQRRSDTKLRVRDTLKRFSSVFFSKKHELTGVFRSLDADHSGALDKAEFKKALSLTSNVSDFVMAADDIDILANYMYPEGVRSLDYDAFMSLMWRVRTMEDFA